MPIISLVLGPVVGVSRGCKLGRLHNFGRRTRTIIPILAMETPEVIEGEIDAAGLGGAVYTLHDQV